MFRERILSWLDEVRDVIRGVKSGTYHDFQADEHLADLGDPTNPLDGLGVMSNLFLTSLIGEVGVSPFLNTSDCLSILDRRFWAADPTLESLRPLTDVSSQDASGGPSFPDANGPYASYTEGDVRPLCPDHVHAALDYRDKFRYLRYVWLAYRTNRNLGTLAQQSRLRSELVELQRLGQQGTGLLSGAGAVS
jgi:hypothetical protein